MSPVTPAGREWVILPIRMPSEPAFPFPAIHEVRLKRHTPNIPATDDSRSLYLKNVPVDSTTSHFRALFASLVGPGRFEGVAFEDEKTLGPGIEPAGAAKIAGYGKKRKRDEREAEERAKEEAAARLPEIWTRRLRRTGGTAVVLLADDKSVELVLRAAAKLHKSKKYPVWGADIASDTPSLGPQWISSHLQLARADKSATQEAVHAFFNVFNRKEKEAAEMAKRMRNEPDEDGFVTVVRGGRAAPANKTEAEEARRKMLDKEERKKSELKDFYRFQLRERRKAEQAALLKRFGEDQDKVKAMKEKRGKFRPET